ncbi:MAG: hypothetical protein WA419_00995 [Silvibacterium sp.]
MLVELLVNAGKLVTREELQQKLWPADTFVDQDKESYYLALPQAQGTIRADAPNWQPWIMFFLRALQQQMKKLARKVERASPFIHFWSPSRIHRAPIGPESKLEHYSRFHHIFQSFYRCAIV